MIAVQRRDVDIVAAVVIVIRNRDSQSINLDIQTGARRDIGKRAVVIIAIERRMRLAPARRPILRVHEQNIQPPVAVGIEESAAGAHSLR